MYQVGHPIQWSVIAQLALLDARHSHKDRIHAALADGGHNHVHHVALAQVDVHVSRSRQLNALCRLQLHFGPSFLDFQS